MDFSKSNYTSIAKFIKFEKVIDSSVDQTCFGTPINQLLNVQMQNVSLPMDQDILDADNKDSVNSEASYVKNNSSINLTIHPSDEHIFLIDYENLKRGIIVPFPSSWEENDDSDEFVRMPCSKYNEIIVNNEKKNRWELITHSLNRLKLEKFNPKTFKDAVMYYHKVHINFEGFQKYWNQVNESQRNQIAYTIIPQIINLVLNTPYICTQPIPLLKCGKSKKLTMSKMQAACVLANAFFCTFPNKSKFSHFPRFNFDQLFTTIEIKSKTKSRLGKLDCLFNYFRRTIDDEPGLLTFDRREVKPKNVKEWSQSQLLLKRLHVSSNGKIETEGKDMLQVDFANKYIGGGVLHNGCVQEEIRFIISPESLISCLITECLNENECLHLIGCEQYSKYKGYARSFVFDGDYSDNVSRDCNFRKSVQIVAIDALSFHSYRSQFLERNLLRELNKAFCGFSSDEEILCPVATGNWGCGAFKGDLQLKAIIQMMAASEAGRDVCYFTFDDYELANTFNNLHRTLIDNNATIGFLMKKLIGFGYEISDSDGKKDLFKYIGNEFK